MSSQNPPRDHKPYEPHDAGCVGVAGQKCDASLFLWGDLYHRQSGRFTCVYDEGIAAIHAGPTVDLAKVVAFEAVPAGGNSGLTEREPEYDLAVFDDAGRCRAIITRSYRGDRVRWLDDDRPDDDLLLGDDQGDDA